MIGSITLQALYECHANSLALSWLAGRDSKQRYFHRDPEQHSNIVGYLNFVHPQQVTIFGEQEFNYLAKMDVNAYAELLQQFFHSKPKLVIIADNQQATDEIIQLAEKCHVPLMTSTKPSQQVFDHLSHFFSTKLAASVIVHGVFLEVFDLGVLLMGDSGAGKSELALELINRNHRLVADDTPILTRISPTVITGSCPPILQDFLEVRGLGVIDIRTMFGSIAIKKTKQLHLIVHIIGHYDEQSDRLYGLCRENEILGIAIPEVTIPIAPGRNIAILIEAAVRDHVLKLSGYHAASQFDKRQREQLEKKHETHCD